MSLVSLNNNNNFFVTQEHLDEMVRRFTRLICFGFKFSLENTTILNKECCHLLKLYSTQNINLHSCVQMIIDL